MGESHSFRRLDFLIWKASEQDAARATPKERGDEAVSTCSGAVPSQDEAMAAFETLQEYLKPLGPEGQLHNVKPMIQRAAQLHAKAEAARKEREARHAVIKSLNGLQNTADHGEYYARNIREDLAAAWSRGEHRPKSNPRGWDETVSTADINAAQNAATGVTIEGAIDDFAGCLSILEGLDGDFAKPIDAKTAEKVYDAYDDVSS